MRSDLPSAKRGGKAPPIDEAPACDAEQVEHRRQDVHETGDGVDPLRGHAGPVDDQRYVCRGFVDEDAVLAFAVLAERLPVIAGDNDRRSCEQALFPHRVQQPGNLGVHIRDRPFVVVTVGTPVLQRKRLGRVRIVEMHPEKEWRVTDVPDPRARVVDDFARRSPARWRAADAAAVAVDLESSGQPSIAAEHHGADERRRAEAARVENLSQRLCAGDSGGAVLSRTPWRWGYKPVKSDA